MKIQRIELENFASYYGKPPAIHLDTKANKPLVIFIGGTGYGKTSIFDAINWALYGEEYEKDMLKNKERSITDYVNETALREAIAKGARVQMGVTLYFEYERENSGTCSEYYVTQNIVVKPTRNSDGSIKAELIERIAHLREIEHSGNHVEIPFNRTFLDEILPSNVKSYFLFDGDRIHNLAKPGNSQEVQDAIYRVVDLEIIRNAAEHLSDTAIEFGKKAAKSATGELATVEDQYNEELGHQNNIKSRISDLKREKQSIKDQIELINEKLKDTAATSALQERREQLNKELLQNGQQQKQNKITLRDHAAKALLYLGNASLERLIADLQEKRSKGEIPKHIRETFFNDLFHLQECICGTKFEAKTGDPTFDHLKKRELEEKDRSAEEDLLLDLFQSLKQADDTIRRAKEDVKRHEDLLIDLEEAEKSLIYQRQEVEKQLGDLPIEDVNKLMSIQKNLHEEDKKFAVDISTLQEQLSVSEEKLRLLDDQRKDLGKKQEEAGALHHRSELAKKSADKLNELYESFAEQSRVDVERLTIEEFTEFVLSSSSYKVALSPEYSLEVLDSNGNRALQRLSMGQSQCLSLAFITAISRVSKKNPPLVIDMPFSRLDPAVHAAISQRLPKLGQQIILFLIPNVEWNEITKANLTSFSNHIYEMTFDEKNRQTHLQNIN